MRSGKRKREEKRVKPALKSFNCKNCGSVVEITVVGQTLNVVCPTCRSIIDANDPDFNILQKGISKRKYTPYIPLKSRGKLHGVLWEATGFVVKMDSGYYWREYLLFNPYHGYRWLVEVDGHWVIYKRIHQRVEVSYDEIYYKSKDYKLFNKGQAKVEYVEGEFFWRVKRNDVTSVADYICPPYALSVEKEKQEENWTFGHHIEAEVIRHAFKIQESIPFQSGVGQVQPSPFKEKFKKSLFPMLIACFAMLIIFIVSSKRADNKTVFQQAYSFGEHQQIELFKTEEFELSGGTSNVKLLTSSNVHNSWVYLDVLLVDANTQKGIPMPVEISYYRGSDWSEGSHTSKRYAYNVPDGRYYLSIKGQYGGRHRGDRKVHIKLKRDVFFISNLFVCMFLILVGPFFILLRKSNFEARRWSNSDYSPYSE